MIPNVLPFFAKIHGEVHHKARYERYPALAAVGVLAEPDEEAERIFSTLVSRNAINFYAPTHTAVVLTRDQDPEGVRAETERVLAGAGAPR
jgi:hypothetical protein